MLISPMPPLGEIFFGESFCPVKKIVTLATHTCIIESLVFNKLLYVYSVQSLDLQPTSMSYFEVVPLDLLDPIAGTVAFYRGGQCCCEPRAVSLSLIDPTGPGTLIVGTCNLQSEANAAVIENPLIECSDHTS